MPSNFSKDDVRNVRFRCPSCGEYAARPLDWSIKHSSFACDYCACLIDLSTAENRDLIRQAAARAKDSPQG